MAKVRVHELVKELNIQSKDIISFLTENNRKKGAGQRNGGFRGGNGEK